MKLTDKFKQYLKEQSNYNEQSQKVGIILFATSIDCSFVCHAFELHRHCRRCRWDFLS